MAYRKLIVLDFDGVLHSYGSGWQGPDVVIDDPVPGATEAVQAYVGAFRMAIYSSRSEQPGGVEAMRQWLRMHLVRALGGGEGSRVFGLVEWPTSKPAAFVTLGDRAIQFQGRWPRAEDIAVFEPWNKREAKRGFAFLGETEADVQNVNPAHDWWAATATTKGWAIVDENPQQLVADVRRVGYGPTFGRAMAEAVHMSVTAASAQLRRGPWLFEEPGEYVSPNEAGPLGKEETAHG